ncbi:glycoside hydrolase family 16 protein [Phenylobacterium sp.]|uniref:glycoside hydrolase family 16 protein n=1 Tax=Phenylobacterium sp. TaxID=1871053 RepID=UPI0035B023DD
MGVRVLLAAVFAAMFVGAAPSAPVNPQGGTPAAPATADPHAWTQRLGFEDLTRATLARVEQAMNRGQMTAQTAADIRARLAAIRAEEAVWRQALEKPPGAGQAILGKLRAVAQEVSWVAPLRPVTPAPTAEWEDLPRFPPLDLRPFRLTFSDEFERMSVTADGGAGPWYAPVHSDFGAAKFDPPGPEGPFFLRADRRAKRPSERSLLEIHARRTPTGWRSGLMQTVDGKGRGFAQTYGYFEMRAKLPPGKATWPAFWLLTQHNYTDPVQDRGEIDVLEHYGTDPLRLHVAVHLKPPVGWNIGGIERPWYRSHKIPILDLRTGFHRYGVLVDRDWVTMYYDGVPLARYPTQPAYRSPLYMLVDLTMHQKGLEAADNPSILQVDYVRAYALPEDWPSR